MAPWLHEKRVRIVGNFTVGKITILDGAPNRLAFTMILLAFNFRQILSPDSHNDGLLQLQPMVRIAGSRKGGLYGKFDNSFDRSTSATSKEDY